MLVNEFISNVALNPFDSFDFVKELTSAEETVVYTFDVVKGTVAKKLFNVAFPKTNKEAFQRHFIACWYNREEVKIAKTAKTFRDKAEALKAGEGSEEEKTSASKLSEEEIAKVNNAISIVDSNEKEFTFAIAGVKAVALHTVPFTIRLFTSVVRKEEASEEVKEYFKNVYGWIGEAKKKLAREVNPFANIKPFKEGLEELTKSLWVPSANCVESYVFHANTRLAVETLQVVYKGLGYDAKGNLKRRYASESEITREVVLQMFKYLLEKEAAKKEAEELAKDENLLKASNPSK